MPTISIPQNQRMVFPAGTILPEVASARFARLVADMVDWNSLTSSTMETLRVLEQQTIVAHDGLEGAKRSRNETRQAQLEAEIEGVMRQRQELAPVLATRNGQAAQLLAIHTRLRGWAEKLPPGTRLMAAAEVEIGSKPVTADRIEAVRDEIVKVENDRQAVESARPAAAELKEKIRASVKALVASGRARPNLTAFLSGKGPIEGPRIDAWYETVGSFKFLGHSDVLALLAWLDPDALAARLCAEVDESRQDPAAELTSDEKAKRLRSLDQTLLMLERQDEALVLAARGLGQTFAHRPNVSPLALLGIAFGEKSHTGGAGEFTPRATVTGEGHRFVTHMAAS